MIHYHGTPITPGDAAAKILTGRHGLVSFRHKQSLDIVADVCASFILDNGAFTAWKSGEPITDWQPFYKWVEDWRKHPGFDWALIPDVIDGDEDANDALLQEWPFGQTFGVPVWHLHESLDRLAVLAEAWPRVALGSSGKYSRPGTQNWWARIRRALESISDPEGRPMCKLHGLRMLNPRVFRHMPLSSADSCNVALNIGLNSRWQGTYTPSSKAWRGMVLAERIEAVQSATKWMGEEQLELAIQG